LRLTNLDIFGFKSFAQKIQIPFGPGITAIVGPNGCGKSNIVEAIRWVLGEQRAGAFRSHKMEEVIFAGSRQRKPLGMSEVSLNIENTNNILPIDFSEVTLTRRLFRSGESDYLLNKIPCRLLDFHNLFMDTGLGQGAYAVMEQGMVDEIISEKTENRRRILEEAAGITKYKVRRRSTWSRLESTKADLTRIEDIITEVKRQVDYMGRQVGRARRYQLLKTELDEKEVLVGRSRFFSIQDDLEPLRRELESLNTESTEGYTRFTAREAELEKLRLAQTEAEHALQEVGRALNTLAEEIHGRERQLVAVREQLNAATQTIDRGERERRDADAQLEQYVKLHREAERDLATARQRLDRIEAGLSEHQQLCVETERTCASRRADLERRNQERMDQMRMQGELSRALERLLAERDSLGERQKTTGEELETLVRDQRDTAARIQTLQAEFGTLDARLEEQTRKRDAGQERTRLIEADLERVESDRQEMLRQIEANLARLQVMEKLHAGFEGYSSGVRTLMLESPHSPQLSGVLGDLIEVDSGYAQATEIALGESLEALLGSSAAGAVEAIDYLKSSGGRAGIYPLDRSRNPGNTVEPPPVAGLLGPLAARVHARDAAVSDLLSLLLHNTFVVEDLAVALELSDRCAGQALRLVTPLGEAIEIDGRITGGKSSAEDSSLIGRRQEIRSLKATAARLKSSLAALDDRMTGALERRRVHALHLARIGTAFDGLTEQRRETAHVCRGLESEEMRLRQRITQLETERTDLMTRCEGIVDSITDQEEKLTAIERESANRDQVIAVDERDLQTAEGVLRSELEQLSELNAEQARTKEQTQSLERERERLESMQRNLESGIERLTVEVAQATESRAALTEQDSGGSGELEAMHADRDSLLADSDSKRQAWDQVNTNTRAMEEEISRIQRQLNSQRERRHELELQITELESRTGQIRDRLLEVHQCDVGTLGRVEDSDVDVDELEARVEAIRQSIQRLGTVHVGVLDEYEEQKERYDFLCEQRDDLLAAAEDLRKTLSLIDRTARRMFKETFEQIRVQFRETFGRFFPGGEADLQLDTDEDALEAGIEIIARPRGKRLQSIGLMSGGERALTAISLLFSIYQVKPSPFCILDEVDAPLDDANIHRFVKVLKEFARTTQFIMVTHNKISMHAADCLHGVTMPEEGVSQLVSVQMDEDFLEEAAG